MKKMVLATLMLLSLGCVKKTEYGPCIGIADDKNPSLTYKVSSRNAVVGIIFVETIIVPVFWLNDQFYCPVGEKK